jgi:hypothetical protein
VMRPDLSMTYDIDVVPVCVTSSLIWEKIMKT